MTEPLLSIRGLARAYYGVKALQGVDFDVRPHTITGLIGPNGAGKTTVFNLITGFLRPSSGRVVFDGQRIDGLAPHAVFHRGLARTFQVPRALT
jgi:branched-chain amino acid transport system ATP-binding protein